MPPCLSVTDSLTLLRLSVEHWRVFQASLWKETLEGKWVCLNEVNLGGKGVSGGLPSDAGTKTL